MRTAQIEITDEGVWISFFPRANPDAASAGRPDPGAHHPPGWSLHAARDTGWLFPGGRPGRHTATENIRRDLVTIGIKPFENRKAAMFQLAATMPSPILAELLGTSDVNAAAWAALAACDWGTYIQHRAESTAPPANRG